MASSNLMCILIGSMLLLSSCISTEQIQTSSPRPASSPLANANTAGMSVFSVTIETGTTPLPADVQALRFTIDEIHLRSEDGEWKVMPAEFNSFEILSNRELSKNILTTRVEPMSYDSIALSLSDLFVLYDENAGGPIAWPRDQPIKEALNIDPQVGVATRVRIVLEPGASLVKDPQCRWYFVPFWTAELY